MHPIVKRIEQVVGSTVCITTIHIESAYILRSFPVRLYGNTSGRRSDHIKKPGTDTFKPYHDGIFRIGGTQSNRQLTRVSLKILVHLLIFRYRLPTSRSDKFIYRIHLCLFIMSRIQRGRHTESSRTGLLFS